MDYKEAESIMEQVLLFVLVRQDEFKDTFAKDASDIERAYEKVKNG